MLRNNKYSKTVNLNTLNLLKLTFVIVDFLMMIIVESIYLFELQKNIESDTLRNIVN